jgi:hypothetical protein
MSMSHSGRKRASSLVLLVLAAGLALGAATAASAGAVHEMACCPDEAAEQRGCAWLGAADCCPERPTAPAPASPSGAPADAATASPLAPVPPVLGVPAPARAGTAFAPHLSRSEVLRL